MNNPNERYEPRRHEEHEGQPARLIPVLAFLCVLCVFVVQSFAQDARTIIQEVQKRNRTESERYEGTLQVIDNKKVTDKRWIYKRKGSFGNSKSVLTFTAPAEVKGVALLIVNHPDRASDQWMWTPSLERERRIAFQDRSTRFFGTDFSFEDLEERDVDQSDFKLLGEEKLDGVDCWVVESRPKEAKQSQYTSAKLWVRKDHYLFVQVESYVKEGVARRMNYTDFAQVQGVWTGRTLTVLDVRRGSKTVMKLEKLAYNEAMKDDDFTIQALRREGS
jgi:outer membrane lipoprotein-sorting protein